MGPSEQQWQRFAVNGHTKELTRTIHVGTPAFLAPEILLKLVKSKGVDLEKERKKKEKLEEWRERALKEKKEREQKEKVKECAALNGCIQDTATTDTTTTVHAIEVMSGDEEE